MGLVGIIRDNDLPQRVRFVILVRSREYLVDFDSADLDWWFSEGRLPRRGEHHVTRVALVPLFPHSRDLIIVARLVGSGLSTKTVFSVLITSSKSVFNCFVRYTR